MSEEKIPQAPPIPREEPKTAPPPNYGGRRYVSAEMQRVADSDAPPDPETELTALRAEVAASHEKIAHLESGHRQLSSSDMRQENKLSDAFGEIRALGEKVAALAPDNAKGAAEATKAAMVASSLDAKTLATLVVTILSFALALMSKLGGGPKDAPVPIVVIAPSATVAPAAPSAIHGLPVHPAVQP